MFSGPGRRGTLSTMRGTLSTMRHPVATLWNLRPSPKWRHVNPQTFRPKVQISEVISK